MGIFANMGSGCLLVVIGVEGFRQRLQRGLVGFEGDLGSRLCFCGLGVRPRTCGLGAGLHNTRRVPFAAQGNIPGPGNQDSVFISSGCRNKAPQTGVLKKRRREPSYSSPEARSPRSGVSEAVLALQVLGQCPLGLQWSLQTLGFRGRSPIT